MPSFLLRWWNAQVASYAKSSDALTYLNTQNANIPPFPAAGLPVPNAAVIPAGNMWSVVCEAMGETGGFVTTGSGAVTRGVGNVTLDTGNAANWVGVRKRKKRSERLHQYGYLGSPRPTVPAAAPGLKIRRLDKGSAGAWPGNNIADWLTDYPVRLNVVPAVLDHTRPASSKVRQYKARREIIYGRDQGLHVFWYHAISGGNPTGLFDLLDTLALLVDTVDAAAAIGGRRVGVLIGDLNFLPGLLNTALSNLGTGLPIPAALGQALTVQPQQIQILRTGVATHVVGLVPRELDYAVVYNGNPAGGNPVNAFIEHLAPPPPVGGAAGAGIPIPSAAGGVVRTTDHRPIKVQVDI